MANSQRTPVLADIPHGATAPNHLIQDNGYDDFQLGVSTIQSNRLSSSRMACQPRRW